MTKFRHTWLGYEPEHFITPELAVLFTVPGEPKSKERPRFNRNTGHAYTPKTTSEREQVIAAAYNAAGGFMFPGMVGLEVCFYLGTRRNRDTDNMLKLVLDGLIGHAYKDDGVAVVQLVSKLYTDKDKARTVIRVVSITERVESYDEQTER